MFRSLGQDIQRSYNYFRRPRVTIGIIAVLLALFVSGLFIPQKSLFLSSQQFEQWNSEHPVLAAVINGLKLNEIYVAPITILFLALFFLNLIAVLLQRIPHTLRRAYLIDRQAATAGMERVNDEPGAIAIVFKGMPPDSSTMLAGKAEAFFRKRSWSVMTSDDGRSILAIRNRYSPLGFLLFHASFLLCLVSGLLVVYTRFSGTLLLTQGEIFYSDIERFKVIDNPKIFPSLPDLGIIVESVSPSYEGATGTDLDVALKIRYLKETFDAVAKINEPVRRGPISILPHAIGISPLFVLKKGGGAVVSGGYFALNVLKGKEDSFQFPDLPYTVALRFYPDFIEEGGVPSSRTQEIRNPVFHVRVQDGGKVLYEGLRRPGENARFDGLELSFSELRYWVDFLVVREYGTTPLAAGFVLGATGLVLRLLFPRKTVRIRVGESDGGCILHMNGSGEYYPQAFREELARSAADLANVLGGVLGEGQTA